MLSVFPDRQEQEEEAFYKQQAEEPDEPKDKAANSGKSGEAVLLHRQEQMQQLLQKFVESHGMNPDDISVSVFFWSLLFCLNTSSS